MGRLGPMVKRACVAGRISAQGAEVAENEALQESSGLQGNIQQWR